MMFSLGDCIGMESCLDLNSDGDDDQDGVRNQFPGKQNQRPKTKKKEFPPPMPSLARTGNLPSHMPWVMKKYYTEDGRLIIREEKVKHHEYFKAHRENGRLTLQLVPLDDDVSDHQTLAGEDADEDEDEENIEIHNGENADNEDNLRKSQVCVSYDSVRRSSSCIFGMLPVPEIRPVHI